MFSATVSLLVIMAMAFTSGQTPQEPATAPKPQLPTGVVIRGCLTGSKLTHIEPGDPSLTLPDRLRVTSIKVIRSQVKALDGHQVELVGLLRGIPGQETGLLVAESDKGKVYLGGGDPNLGQDLGSARAEPPTIHANTIKDVAPACTARPLPSEVDREGAGADLRSALRTAVSAAAAEATSASPVLHTAAPSRKKSFIRKP